MIMLRHWPTLLVHESEAAPPFQSISGVNSTVFLRRVSRKPGQPGTEGSQWTVTETD
jgi:hypothetical protein